MIKKVLAGSLLLLSATFSLAADNESEYEQFLAEMPETMEKVGSMIGRCALHKEPTLCDSAGGLVSVMKAKLEALPEEEKANHATSLAIVQSFIDGLEASSASSK